MARGQTVHQRGTSLKDEVREALLTILRDTTAPATARAQAGRTLLDMDASGDSGDVKAANEMTADEIDAEIASNEVKQR